MYRYFFTALLIFSINFSFSQFTTCATAAVGAPVASGSCLTNQNAATAVTAANCGGGFNSGVGFYYPFVAGSCPQFTLTFNANEEVQFLLWNTSCTNMAIECSNATANTPIFESFSAVSGPTLTPGTTYILEVVTKTASNFSICYQANQPEAANNECSGASGVSPTGVTFNNGGNCAYSGSANDATTSDPTPPSTTFCAGSLENTLWTQFQPVAGATSFQISGSGIACGGPACAWQFGFFSGACGALIPEGCISNGNPCVSGPDPNSALTAPSGGNGTYLVTWNTITATGFTGTVTQAGGVPFTGTEVFYLAMDGNANSDCQFTLSGTNIQPLPMELISFNIEKYNNSNLIIWEVATQIDNDFFTIQRSEDGENWIDVSEVDGAGTTTQQRKYAVVDTDFRQIVNYYRLKQTNFNASFEFSKIVAVDNTPVPKTIVKSYDLLGKPVAQNHQGLVIFEFSDGSTEKRFNP